MEDLISRGADAILADVKRVLTNVSGAEDAQVNASSEAPPFFTSASGSSLAPTFPLHSVRWPWLAWIPTLTRDYTLTCVQSLGIYTNPLARCALA